MLQTKYYGRVCELTVDNPPVNALGAELRQALHTAIADSSADDAVDAIVIRGAGKLFSAGADITEFEKASPGLTLPDLIASIERAPKPIVAAVHNAALGGGLEIALGCHYRIATPSARLGLPEVSLGLLPGAGGTQRLPRLIGAGPALEMIVGGAPVSGKRALELGLVDRLADQDALAEAAISFASGLSTPRTVSDDPVKADPTVFADFKAANARKIGAKEAPLACIEAVKAAVELPLDQGLAVERAWFIRLREGEQSKALRHVFFAERKAGKIDDIPADTREREIRRVGVIGAGTMGGGIAMNFLSAGIPVTIVETSAEALDRGLATIRRNYEAAVSKGRMTPAQLDSAMGSLTPTLDFEALNECDLVIEAVFENMDVKKDIFGRLDTVAKPGAILASNTSYLSIDEIAAATSRPGDVVGLHFFSPANIMKLVEIVRGAATAPDVLKTAMSLAAKIRKVPVISGVCYGFIGNRMLIPRQQNALALLLEGATVEQVDRVHLDFGMPMGPFQMTDLAGVDIGWHRDPERIDTIRDALCAQGRLGQKTKAGFYDYDQKRQRSHSAEVDRVVEDFRAKAQISVRDISDEEIVARTLYTMVNEGAKILEEGISQRASDIDVVWINGYGWPREKGGPIFWANSVGLKTIVDALDRFAPMMGGDFRISQRLVDCARTEQPLA